jgi:HAD superfamily hydrolase (TIGR01509 family)
LYVKGLQAHFHDYIAINLDSAEFFSKKAVESNQHILCFRGFMPLHISRIRALCFDVDGTLSDTDDVMVAKLTGLLRPFHFLFPRKDIGQVARHLVMMSEAPANFLVGIPDTLGLDGPVNWLIDLLYRTLGHKPKKNFLIVPGTQEMLQSLSRRYPLAVVTARDARSTNVFLEQYNLLPYFKCIATAQTCKHTKPYPDPIRWAAEQMGVTPEDCLMVGDTTVDIRAGKAAGAQTVGVLCGFGEEPELRDRGADMILATTLKLVQVLEE